MVERREAQRLSPSGARGFAKLRERADRQGSLKDVSPTSWRLPPLHRRRGLRGGEETASLGRSELRRENDLAI